MPPICAMLPALAADKYSSSLYNEVPPGLMAEINISLFLKVVGFKITLAPLLRVNSVTPNCATTLRSIILPATGNFASNEPVVVTSL